MNPVRLALFTALALPFVVGSCAKQEEAKAQVQAEAPAPAPVAEKPAEPAKAPEPVATPPAPAPPSQYAVTDPDVGLGDFGSSEPIERADAPTRGTITLPIVQETNFAPA